MTGMKQRNRSFRQTNRSTTLEADIAAAEYQPTFPGVRYPKGQGPSVAVGANGLSIGQVVDIAWHPNGYDWTAVPRMKTDGTPMTEADLPKVTLETEGPCSEAAE
jgi:hypothetical protein